MLLANIDTQTKITKIYPTWTIDSSTKEIGKPKYGIITTFIFDGYYVNIEPSESGEVTIISGLPKVFIKTLREGLGLKKEYRFIVEIPNEYLKDCDTITISKIKQSAIDNTTLIINDKDLEKIRKGINNTHKLYLNEAQKSKQLFVYNEVLHNINPKQYPELKKPTQKEVIYKILKDTDFNKTISKSDKNTLSELKDTADLSYLQVLAKEFEIKIKENHKEETYQKFFEENPFLLTMFAGSSLCPIQKSGIRWWQIV
jgi:hypothetical protein